ncbi:MAG: hypothetical protein ABFD79_12065 [Phycisphaerales bacterium]
MRIKIFPFIFLFVVIFCSIANANTLKISQNENKIIAIAVKNKNSEPNFIIDPKIRIPSDCNKIVIVTHGWVDRGKGRFAEDIASAIKSRVDANQWLCCYFEWPDGAMTINSIASAEYARDIAGVQLAKAIVKLGNFEHIHLIGHSAGCWAIDRAAKIIEEQSKTQIHLTFLDAYVPKNWCQSDLGSLKKTKIKFIEHYYTRDVTFGVTQINLSNACNIDITQADPGLTEHKFPLRWYYATITGRYHKSDYRCGSKVYFKSDGIDYGFARSFEAGRENWEKSLMLSQAENAVKLSK